MDEAGFKELSHPGIDDGKARFPDFPFFEILSRFIPWQAFPVLVELMIEDVGKMVENGEVELPPSEFFDIHPDGFALATPGVLILVLDLRVECADRDETMPEILGETGCGFSRGNVAEVGIVVDDLGNGMVHPITSSAFAWVG